MYKAKNNWVRKTNVDALTLSQTKKFRLFQTERISRGQFQMLSEWQKVPEKGRKHSGKRRNCSLRAISPFSTVFSKDLFCGHVKPRACLGKGQSGNVSKCYKTERM